MKILIILFQIILTSQIYCQSLIKASKDKKAEMFLRAFSNQGTASSYIVFTASNVNTNKTKEICTKSIDLYWALVLENPNILNVDSLGATYAYTRQIPFANTKALNRINFKNYHSETVIEIEDSITNTEKEKIAKYYDPKYQRKYNRIKKNYYKKTEKCGKTYFRKNVKLITDSITKKFLENFKYDVIYNLNIMKIYPDSSAKKQEEFELFNRGWLKIKKDIDTKYYIKNPVEKYSNKYGIYFFHYLFNHGVMEYQGCLGGVY